MFLPNTTCTLYRRSQTQDNFGRYSFYPAVTWPCTIAKSALKVQVSSPRADQSASRGNAEQVEGTVTILFPANDPPKIGDVIFAGTWLEVIDVAGARDLLGAIDHYTITAKQRQAIPQ